MHTRAQVSVHELTLAQTQPREHAHTLFALPLVLHAGAWHVSREVKRERVLKPRIQIPSLPFMTFV